MDEDLDNPLLAANFYIDYKSMMQLLFEIEAGPLVVLSHFQAMDLFVTRLLSRICKEIGFPYNGPLASGHSAQFYYALPDMDLVMIPMIESSHLLGLADLYHELAHFVLRRGAVDLIQPFHAIIDKTYDGIVEDSIRRNATPPEIALIESSRGSWKRAWQEEFSADMIAAFLVGPAFGWENVRLCTNMSSPIFTGGNSHPADDSRRLGIRSMLLRLGFGQQADRIDAWWQELVRLSNELKPNNFDVVYPPSLLEELCEFLFRECSKLGLVAWSQHSLTSQSVGSLLNEAWDTFLDSPATFGDYEHGIVERLKREVGVA